MAQAQLKTKATKEDISAFLKKKVTDAPRRDECVRLAALMEEATGAPARVWGTSIVGFGEVHLTYESGREVDWFHCGFAPRKDALVLYGIRSEGAAAEKLVAKLGKFKSEKGCLYVKKLADIDLTVLEKLVRLSASKPKK